MPDPLVILIAAAVTFGCGRLLWLRTWDSRSTWALCALVPVASWGVGAWLAEARIPVDVAALGFLAGLGLFFLFTRRHRHQLRDDTHTGD